MCTHACSHIGIQNSILAAPTACHCAKRVTGQHATVAGNIKAGASYVVLEAGRHHKHQAHDNTAYVIIGSPIVDVQGSTPDPYSVAAVPPGYQECKAW